MGNTLRSIRKLQAKGAAKGGAAKGEAAKGEAEENDVGPEAAPEGTKKKAYTAFEVKKFPGNWTEARTDFYEKEAERLNRERAFHSAEFQRYVRQQKWNDERKKVMTDEGKSIADRTREIRDLDEQARIDIDTLDAGINLKQNLRNPQNREVDRAERIFNEKKDTLINSINAYVDKPVLPKQGVEDRRRAQAKVPAAPAKATMTAAQTKSVADLKKMWADMVTALQAQIDLNSKFHTVEFYEFAYDEHRLADMKNVWESELPDSSKSTLWWRITKLYREVKAPAAKLINDSNNARKAAQNTVNTLEGQYARLIRDQKLFTWAT
jgi:hypothetical protein